MHDLTPTSWRTHLLASCERMMPIFLLMLLAGTAFAESTGSAQAKELITEGGGLIQEVVKVLIKYVLPLVAVGGLIGGLFALAFKKDWWVVASLFGVMLIAGGVYAWAKGFVDTAAKG